MSNEQMIADRYIAIWNESDNARRRALIATAWTEDARYADPLMSGHGHSEIDAMIAAVQAKYPGYRFTRLGNADKHGDHLRFSWSFAPEAGPEAARGTDFATLNPDGRLARVIGFLDTMPQAA
ncbi:MAG TPA: nuclear transport factor 2 family protein [Acetobacteraceae bacterium]